MLYRFHNFEDLNVTTFYIGDFQSIIKTPTRKTKNLNKYIYKRILFPCNKIRIKYFTLDVYLVERYLSDKMKHFLTIWPEQQIKSNGRNLIHERLLNLLWFGILSI